MAFNLSETEWDVCFSDMAAVMRQVTKLINPRTQRATPLLALMLNYHLAYAQGRQLFEGGFHTKKYGILFYSTIVVHSLTIFNSNGHNSGL
jgi:hypothetical protein